MPDIDEYGQGVDPLDDAENKPPSPVEEGVVAASLLDQLRQRREELRGDRYHDFPVPGYDKFGLWVRVRPYSVSKSEGKIRNLAKRQKQGDPVVLQSAQDNILDATDTLLTKQKGQEPVPFHPERSVGWVEFAELIGVPEPERVTARAALTAIFPTEQSILDLSADIQEWLVTAKAESLEDFEGESEGTE